jgi:hypothetical protein
VICNFRDWDDTTNKLKDLNERFISLGIRIMQLNKFETAVEIFSYFSISRRSYFSISRRYSSFFAGFILGYLMLRTWFILEKSYFFLSFEKSYLELQQLVKVVNCFFF